MAPDANCTDFKLDVKSNICYYYECARFESRCNCVVYIKELNKCLEFPISYSIKCNCNCQPIVSIIQIVIVIEFLFIVLIVYRVRRVRCSQISQVE